MGESYPRPKGQGLNSPLKIKTQYLEERVLSLIIEFSFDQEIFSKVLETIKEALDDLNTVVSLDVITKFKENKKIIEES